MRDYFILNYGSRRGKLYKKAKKEFARSLAAYCLVTYILQIKDRHNGNILVDTEGHIMHIDFGFILCIAPGKGIKFEKAPFKFKRDYVEILGGVQSKTFSKFKKMMVQGFLAVQENADKLILLVEMMCLG